MLLLDCNWLAIFSSIIVPNNEDFDVCRKEMMADLLELGS